MLPDQYNTETKEGRWQYMQVLGEGAFGIVHEATDVQTGTRVAIKVLRTKRQLDCLLASREVRCARQFRNHVFPLTKHRVFVDYLEDQTGLAEYPDEALFVWADNGSWEGKKVDSCLRSDAYVVMEYIEGVSVREMIRNDSLTLPDCGAVLHQAAFALKGLHDHHCIHRDFRVHNLMWHDGKLKVLDFGLAMMDCVSGTKATTNPLVRTFWQADSYWMPPEVKRHGKMCNFFTGAAYSFDMYSFGVLVVELLLDRMTHKKMTRNRHAIEEQGKTRLDPLKAAEFINRAHLKASGFRPEFLARCLHPIGQERPSPDTVLQIKEKTYRVTEADTESKSFRVFRHELNTVAGPKRADTSFHLIGEISKKIIDNSEYVNIYSEILLKCVRQGGYSIYRILCIIDCVCRFAGKTKSTDLLQSVTSAFAPMMKYFVQEAYKKYDVPNPSGKDGISAELGKVETFIASWIRFDYFTEEELTAKVREPPNSDENAVSIKANDERVAKQKQRLLRAQEQLKKKEPCVLPNSVDEFRRINGAVNTTKEHAISRADEAALPGSDEKRADNDLLARRLAKVQQLMCRSSVHPIANIPTATRQFRIGAANTPEEVSSVLSEPVSLPPNRPAELKAPTLIASSDDDARLTKGFAIKPIYGTSKTLTQSTTALSLISSESSEPRVRRNRRTDRRVRSRSKRCAPQRSKRRVHQSRSKRRVQSRSKQVPQRVSQCISRGKKRLRSVSSDSPTSLGGRRESSRSSSAERARRFVIERNARLKSQEEEERYERLKRREEEIRKRRQDEERLKRREEEARKKRQEEERLKRREEEMRKRQVEERKKKRQEEEEKRKKWWQYDGKEKRKATAHRNSVTHFGRQDQNLTFHVARNEPVRWQAASDVSSESSIQRRLYKLKPRHSVMSSESSFE